jgi:hypothetical protein
MFHKAVPALGGSDVSRKAAELAEAIAQRFHSEVLAVHVREFSYTGDSTWVPEWVPELEGERQYGQGGGSRSMHEGDRPRNAPPCRRGRLPEPVRPLRVSFMWWSPPAVLRSCMPPGLGRENESADAADDAEQSEDRGQADRADVRRGW